MSSWGSTLVEKRDRYPHEMIYLPPNGVNVHYAKTERMQKMWPNGLAHPRTYITHRSYRLLLFNLVFCEWTDERKVTRYYGFAEEDADQIIENKDTEDVKAHDPVLIVPLSQGRDVPGNFYDQLFLARQRFLFARASHDNRYRKNRGDTMAPFLVFFASVARHDDPVVAETLSPIECIARAALVAHEHDEEKRRKAMELLAKQSGQINRSVTTMVMEMVCEVFVLIVVFGNEAYDFIVYFVARMLGSVTGRFIGEMLGSNSIACWVYFFVDVAVVLVTMFAPLLLVGIPTTFLAVAASSAVSEAKVKCTGSSATQLVQWLIGALGNSIVRIVTGLLHHVDFAKDVPRILEAARQTVSSVLGDIAIGVVFQFVDEGIAKYLNENLKKKKMNKLVACFIRVMIHVGVAKGAIETTTNAMYGKAYLRMLVPRWMNIASIGVGNTKAERNKELMKKADEVAGKEADLKAAKGALEKATKGIEDAEREMTNVYTVLEHKRKNVEDAQNEMSGWASSTQEVQKQSGRTMKDLQDNIRKANKDLRNAQEVFEALKKSIGDNTTEKSEAERKVANLRKEIDEAKEATEYKERRDEATKKAREAKMEVDAKREELRNAKLALNSEQNKKDVDQEKIRTLKTNVANAQKDLADASLKSNLADEKDHYAEATKRRPGEVSNAIEKARLKRDQAAALRKPGESQNINGSDKKNNSDTEEQKKDNLQNATALEAEAAEIEREHEVNQSASNQMVEWMANKWKKYTWDYFTQPTDTTNPTSMGSHV